VTLLSHLQDLHFSAAGSGARRPFDSKAHPPNHRSKPAFGASFRFPSLPSCFAPRATMDSTPCGSGRCKVRASTAGAVIQRSVSGIAFGCSAPISALGSVESEPRWRPAAVRLRVGLGEAGERHDAATFDTEPAAPVRRCRIAHVGHTRIRLLAGEREHWRRHSPARHHQLAAFGLVPDDRRRIIRENARQRRHFCKIGPVG